MSNNALEAQGLRIQIGNGVSPETFSDIEEVKTANPFSGSAAEIDTTSLMDTAKTIRMGLQDWGQVALTLNFLPKNTEHAMLIAAKRDRQPRNFKLILTDASPATTYSFAAYVTSVPLTASVDAVIEGNVTLRITGDVTED